MARLCVYYERRITAKAEAQAQAAGEAIADAKAPPCWKFPSIRNTKNGWPNLARNMARNAIAGIT